MPIDDLDYQEQKAVLLAAHARLRDSAHRTADALLADARVLRSITEDGTEIIEHPLYHGEWVKAYGGKVEFMLIDDASTCFNSKCPMASPACICPPGASAFLCAHAACTRVLCKTDGGPGVRHKHTFNEFVSVIQGEFREGDRVIGPGQTMFFPAHQYHLPVVHGLILVCWQPPLERFSAMPELAAALK